MELPIPAKTIFMLKWPSAVYKDFWYMCWSHYQCKSFHCNWNIFSGLYFILRVLSWHNYKALSFIHFPNTELWSTQCASFRVYMACNLPALDVQRCMSCVHPMLGALVPHRHPCRTQERGGPVLSIRIIAGARRGRRITLVPQAMASPAANRRHAPTAQVQIASALLTPIVVAFFF